MQDQLFRAAKLACVIATCLLASSCGHPPRPDTPAAAIQQNDDCKFPVGWQAIEKTGNDLVVFGEQHGTSEAPAFVSNTVCALAMSGNRVAVAIEWPVRLNDDLQGALLKSSQEFDFELMNLLPREKVDGTTSVAMLDLVKRIHNLKSRGYDVNVFAFGGFETGEQFARLSKLVGQNQIEAAYAENIEKQIRGRGYDFVLVLVGNLHAIKTPVRLGEMVINPMAVRLSESHPTTSLNMLHDSGSAWSCRRVTDSRIAGRDPEARGAAECRVHQISGNGNLGLGPFVRLADKNTKSDQESFDGIFWVGPVTASPPPID
jgi:hypothetical protein